MATKAKKEDKKCVTIWLNSDDHATVKALADLHDEKVSPFAQKILLDAVTSEWIQIRDTLKSWISGDTIKPDLATERQRNYLAALYEAKGEKMPDDVSKWSVGKANERIRELKKEVYGGQE